MEKTLLTADIYWASKPPAVRELRTPYQKDKAMELAKRGEIIDNEIMIRGGDPLFVMQLRQDYGYTWVPHILQPQIAVAPGLWVPWLPSYDPTKIPQDAIKVSIYAEDYPPFDAPAVEVPKPKVIVGTSVFPDVTGVGSMWYSGPGDTEMIGAEYVDARGRFVKKSARTIGGRSIWWERVA